MKHPNVIFYIETIEEQATYYFRDGFAYKSRSVKLQSIYLPKQDVQVECQIMYTWHWKNLYA